MDPKSIDFDRLTKEVQFSAVRSRGPGGQNVNKVSSAAVLYWDIASSKLFSYLQKDLLFEKLTPWLNKEGQIYLRSDEFRDLGQNKSRCIEKLAELLRRALHKPKVRRPTKPTRSSLIKKAESKQRRGQTKAQRKKVQY